MRAYTFKNGILVIHYYNDYEFIKRDYHNKNVDFNFELRTAETNFRQVIGEDRYNELSQALWNSLCTGKELLLDNRLCILFNLWTNVKLFKPNGNTTNYPDLNYGKVLSDLIVKGGKLDAIS